MDEDEIIDVKMNRLSFNWKGVTMYLPKITITKDLRRVADEHNTSKSKLEQVMRASTPVQLDDWNPSWDDDDDDSGVYWLASYGSPRGNEKSFGTVDLNIVKIEEPIANENEQIETNSDSLQNKPSDSGPTKAKLSQLDILKKKLKSNQPFQNLLAFNTLSQAGSRSCEKCGQTYNNLYTHQQACTKQRTINTEQTHPVRKIGTIEESNEDLTCKDCGKIFAKKIHLILHLKIHAKMNNAPLAPPKIFNLVCSVCSLRFATNNDLVKHFNLNHYNSNSYVDVAQLVPPSLTNDNIPNTWDHCATDVLNLGYDPVTCATCLQIFSTTEELQQHEIIHTRAPLTCLVCGENFLSASALMTHSLTHDENETAQSKFGCSRCGRRFGRQNQLNFHTKFCKTSKQIQSVKSSSTSISPIADPVEEEESYPNDDNLHDTASALASATIETNHPKMKFECNECGRTFKHQHYLNFHKKVHTKKCKNCGLQFNYNDFATHSQVCGPGPVAIPTIYNGEEYHEAATDLKTKTTKKYFACEICGEIFEEDAKLSEHYLVHDFSNEDVIVEDELESKLPYVCEYAECNTRFSDNSDLKCHISQKHLVKGNSISVKTEISPFSNPKYFYINDSNRQPPVPYVLISTQTKRAAESEMAKFSNERKRGRKPTIYPKYTGPPPKILKRPSHIITRGKKPRDDIPFQNFYICHICNKKIDKRMNFLTHLSQHNGQGNHKCNLCERRFYSKDLLNTHTKRHEDPSYNPRIGRPVTIPYQDVYTCDQCDPPQKITRRQAFINHMYFHKQRNRFQFQCRHCLKNCSTKQNLLLHMTKHTNPRVRSKVRGRPGRIDIPVQDVYTCTFCDKGKHFTNRQRFLIHIRYHGLEYKFICPMCPRRFKVDNSLQSHIESHSQVRRFDCGSCLKKFVHKVSLKIHAAKYCKKVPCKYRCKYCEDAFHSVTTLRRHHIRWHSAETAIDIKYPCPQCGKSFDTFKKRKQHLEKIHPVSVSKSAKNSKIPEIEATAYEDTSPAAWSPEGNHNHEEYIDVSRMLETSICETQENNVPSRKVVSKIKKRDASRPICFCGAIKKYKSQKFCDRPTRCVCVQAKTNCCSDCRCEDSCLNQCDSELQQQQTFKDGKDHMIQQESIEICATFGNAHPIHSENSASNIVTTNEKVDNRLNNSISTSSIIRINGYAPSEYISLDCEDVDESIRELTFSGYVEGDEVDPLADLDPVDSQDSNEAVELVAKAEEAPPQLPVSHQASPQNTNYANSSTLNIPEHNEADILSRNLNFQNEPRSLNCDFCNICTFNLMPAYMSHILYHGDGTSSFTCPICMQKLNCVRSFIMHLDQHNKGVVYSCRQCTSKFKSSDDMSLHLKVHHYKPMECGVCLMNFQSSHSLMLHWSKQHPTVQCGLCMVKFFSYENLTYHMQSLHSPYECAFCLIRIEKVEDLIDHVIKNHYAFARISSSTSTLSAILCEYCGDKFNSAEDRNWHVKNVHRAETNVGQVSQVVHNQVHRCYICMDTFSTLENLNEHTLKVHVQTSTTTAEKVENRMNEPQAVILEAVEAFACSECGRNFDTRGGLTQHLRSHLGKGKRAMCASCNSLFRTRKEFKKHLETTSCVVFECHVCFRNYRFQTHLATHLRTHAPKSYEKHDDSRSILQCTLQQSSDKTGISFSSENGNEMDSSFTTPVIIASTSLSTQVDKSRQNQTYIEEITLD